ncbi:FAD dependent oxidoreductase [Ramaria rubella]|nr:FAD dependent oxidoreductase [Ramaria rubella]
MVPELLQDLPVPLLQDRLSLLSLSSSSVSLPHNNPTKSFWTHGSQDANPLAKEGSEGPFTNDADIVIIGSGITGVGAAYHLSEVSCKNNLSLKVVILEARDFWYSAAEALKRLALETHTADSIVSLIESTGHEAEVDLVHGGHLDLFFSDREEVEWRADWEAAKAAGVDPARVQFLSRNETHQMYGPAFPAVRFSGHNLWPLKAVTHFLKLAQQKFTASNTSSELILHTQTPVTSIMHLNTPYDHVNSTTLHPRWLLNTPRGAIRANIVVHATNGYAAHLLPFFTAAPGRESIVPTRGQVIAARSSVGIDKLRKPSYGANDGYEYWFPRPVNASAEDSKPLVILGGGRETGGPDFELGVTDDSVLNPATSKTLHAFLIPGGMPEMEWTGIMGYTKSGDPLVGPVIDTLNGVRFEGQYIAAGYTGHGMPRAFGCAEALVQMLVSDLRNETWKVPKWFPRHFLTTSRER